jgi:NADPH:quinone reductase-like Zn-dependent oxidoreductase
VNYLTAHLLVIHPGALQPGESILIHGAAGGVGNAAIQLAQMVGAGAIYSTSSPSKHDYLRKLGVIPVDRDDFRRDVRNRTDGRGVDLVLDAIGGKHLKESYRCLSSAGRVGTYGLSAMAPGPKPRPFAKIRAWLAAPRFDPLRMMGANRGLFGVHLGAFRDMSRLAELRDELFTWLAEGKITPVIDSVHPAAEAAAAHQHMHDRRNIGKILLDFD